jgi:hypothetical protein
MAYQPLVLAPRMPEIVERLMRNSVEPFLQDVHCALRLPMRKPKLPAGFNFTTAHVLLGVVAGVSAAFYRRGLSDGKAFTGVLVDYYPWELEPRGAGDAADKAGVLWHTFRNPFSHSLGLAFEKDRGKPRELRPRPFQVKIGRDKNGMKEREIVALERSSVRPDLNPTLVVEPHKRVLWVEPFSWGIRTMLYRVSADARLMGSVQRYVDAVIANQDGKVNT